MSKFYCEPVIACTADGVIKKLDAETMQALVEECRKDSLSSSMDAGTKAKRMISLAGTCRTNGYASTALELYREAIEIIKEDASKTWSHRNKELMYMAARGVDSILPCGSPTAFDMAVYFYMVLHDEYLYTVLNIDNEMHLQEILRFEEKHNIKLGF